MNIKLREICTFNSRCDYLSRYRRFVDSSCYGDTIEIEGVCYDHIQSQPHIVFKRTSTWTKIILCLKTRQTQALKYTHPILCEAPKLKLFFLNSLIQNLRQYQTTQII